MLHATEPISIGSIEMSSVELEALRLYRNYKILRDAAGWRSGSANKHVSILKDLLGEGIVPKNNAGEVKGSQHRSEPPFTRRGYQAYI